MQPHSLLLVTILGLVALVGCEKKPQVIIVDQPPVVTEPRTRTLETGKLRSTVDVFERNPTAENEADVKKALADLDGEIAELQGHVARKTGADREEAAIKLRNLASFREVEIVRFNKTLAARPLTAAPEPGVIERRVDPRTGAEKAEDAARKSGEAVKDAGEKIGDAIKDAVN